MSDPGRDGLGDVMGFAAELRFGACRDSERPSAGNRVLRQLSGSAYRDLVDGTWQFAPHPPQEDDEVTAVLTLGAPRADVLRGRLRLRLDDGFVFEEAEPRQEMGEFEAVVFAFDHNDAVGEPREDDDG